MSCSDILNNKYEGFLKKASLALTSPWLGRSNALGIRVILASLSWMWLLQNAAVGHQTGSWKQDHITCRLFP